LVGNQVGDLAGSRIAHDRWFFSLGLGLI
jgi:hypothetical protein